MIGLRALHELSALIFSKSFLIPRKKSLNGVIVVKTSAINKGKSKSPHRTLNWNDDNKGRKQIKREGKLKQNIRKIKAQKVNEKNLKKSLHYLLV
jgi:hypothetical protein